jgi:hypothetical protein
MAQRLVTVWIVRSLATGLYEAGEGSWTGARDNRRWVPQCTAESRGDATEYTDDDFAATFPDGLPEGWEKIRIMEFMSKKK